MTRNQTFTTTVTLPDETEVEVAVTYTFHKGWKGDRTDPPEPDSVEIQSVTPDIPDWDTLVEECFDDHANYLADAAEYRWRMARDD